MWYVLPVALASSRRSQDHLSLTVATVVRECSRSLSHTMVGVAQMSALSYHTLVLTFVFKVDEALTSRGMPCHTRP